MATDDPRTKALKAARTDMRPGEVVWVTGNPSNDEHAYQQMLRQQEVYGGLAAQAGLGSAFGNLGQIQQMDQFRKHAEVHKKKLNAERKDRGIVTDLRIEIDQWHQGVLE